MNKATLTMEGGASLRKTTGEKNRSWRRRMLLAGTVSGGSVLVVFVVLELCLRLGSWEVKSLHHIGALHRHHAVLGREQIPAWEAIVAGVGGEIRYRINRHGCRDPDDTGPERSPGVSRVCVFGDSLTWGWGVEGSQIISERLEEQVDAEFVNFGMNAVGTGLEWLLLKERGLAFHPDIVLLNFFVGNDYQNNLSLSRKRPHFRLDAEGRVTVGNVPVPYPLSRRVSAFAKRNFLSYFFVGYYAEKARNEIQYGDQWYSGLYRALVGESDEQKAGEPDLTLRDSFRREPRDEMQRAYRVTEALLREFRDSCPDRTRLLVAVLPDRVQVEDEGWENLFRQHGVRDLTPYDRQKPTQVCLELCDRLGIEAVDLLSELRAKHRSGIRVYLPKDIHLNSDGHEVAAAVIGDKLCRLGWLRKAVR